MKRRHFQQIPMIDFVHIHKKKAFLKKLSKKVYKNDGVLPLDINTESIAFIGPHANEKNILGAWVTECSPDDVTPILECVK
ncbi:MAG: hypothetical protein II319_02075, partial [Clostridia bacterium]|nr:hypothetical protein [Clostridia bacterium]